MISRRLDARIAFDPFARRGGMLDHLDVALGFEPVGRPAPRGRSAPPSGEASKPPVETSSISSATSSELIDGETFAAARRGRDVAYVRAAAATRACARAAKTRLPRAFRPTSWRAVNPAP